MDKYDFIELVIYDIHSIPRGRLVARRRVMSALKKGIGFYSAMCYFGIQDQPNATDYFGVERNFGNSNMVPIPNTLVDAPMSGEHRVGQVLCNLVSIDGTMEPTTPRYVAQRQIERLAEMGLTIRSSHEIEFSILDKEMKAWGHNAQWGDMAIISEKQGVLLDLITELSASGVHGDAIQTEAGQGQYEITMDIAEGLEGPDMTSRFKSISRVFFRKRDLNATFMTKIVLEGLSSGFHFNHSLWTRDGANAFLDTDQPDRLSQLGRHWLAGLITHTPALTALLCPTVNCYRRLHNPWTPFKSDWGSQNRLSSYRLVTESDNNIYMECRLPSSACNAYVVMAGMLAAGMDGINRRLSLDDANQEAEIPHSLEEALNLLEDDSILVEALGKKFVECYTYVKRTYEVEHMKALGTCSDAERLEEEKKLYLWRL